MSPTKEQSEFDDGYNHEEEMSPELRRASSHAPHGMPVSLMGLSEKELAKVGRSATFKIDIIVMPCLVVMYIVRGCPSRWHIADGSLTAADELPRSSEHCVGETGRTA